eukprot:COSAG04_NODE_93_length_26686_cov_10.174364_23_plen_187_part_00
MWSAHVRCWMLGPTAPSGSRAAHAGGKTALEIAEANGKAEVAALLRSPAEQAAFERRQAAQPALDGQLCAAANTGDAAAIERLAAEGASPNAKQRGKPAVVRAALNGHAAAVSALARLGADLDARDKRGKTALMEAAYAGEVECARALLAGGADRTLRATGGRYRGKTALAIAYMYGKAEVAALLR